CSVIAVRCAPGIACTVTHHNLFVREIRGGPRAAPDGATMLAKAMTPDELTRWRKAERRRLLAAREALDAGALEHARLRLGAHLGARVHRSRLRATWVC